jgi:hypothetical protein
MGGARMLAMVAAIERQTPAKCTTYKVLNGILSPV